VLRRVVVRRSNGDGTLLSIAMIVLASARIMRRGASASHGARVARHDVSIGTERVIRYALLLLASLMPAPRLLQELRDENRRREQYVVWLRNIRRDRRGGARDINIELATRQRDEQMRERNGER